jgi:hypothetical protein
MKFLSILISVSLLYYSLGCTSTTVLTQRDEYEMSIIQA